MRRPTSRLAVVPALAAALALATLAPASASPSAHVDPYGSVRNILPPGQSGSVNAVEAARVVAGDPQNRVARDGENAPENFADQLEMYDALGHADPSEVTGSTLHRFYKKAPLSLPESESVRTLRPRPGVEIRYDRHGVPYITGQTRDDVSFGAGYAGTLDRMFLMDVLRHAGQARAAEFLGATEYNLSLDQSQMRSAYYTEEEAARQISSLPERFGENGELMLAQVDAFLDGINTAQDEMCPGGLPTGADCPVEYAALQKKPEPWDRADIVYVASLVGGIFGKGGGHEVANASWLGRLTNAYGSRAGRAIYEDLRAEADPESPTTATVETPYMVSPVDPTRPGVALPDPGGPSAPGTGAGVDGSPLPPLPPLAAGSRGERFVLDLPAGRFDLGRVGLGMSNAALLAGDRTASGHPLAVFGPQTAYFSPQLLTEQVLIGPGVRVRGVSFAGTHVVVQLGRGVDYAWSATSAGSDNVDTVAERLCEPDGSAPTVESEHYLRDGRCVPMQRDEHSYTAVPNVATGPDVPRTYRYLVLRTHHGIVLERREVDGEPVALAVQRSTYGHEIDSAVGFALLNDPTHTRDAASFADAVENVDYTFNWFYADDQDISYYSSGLLPRRARGVDPDLPRWGDAQYDWRGWLPDDAHVHQTNPPTGTLVSWNNRPAPGFGAADDQWGYGAVHRSEPLARRVGALARRGDGRPADLVRAVQDAATVDARAQRTLPLLLEVIGDDPATRGARRLIRDWLASGAHRIDRDRDGAYAHQAAIALFDEWWESAEVSGTGDHAVARDVMRGTLRGLTPSLPAALDDHPRHGLGSAWLSSAWYGYVNKDLRSALGRDVPGWSRTYCGGGSLTACRTALRASLRAAVARALDAQGVSSPSALRYDKSLDDIVHTSAGVVGVRRIDWQNRPTFQQVVHFTAHRG